MSSVQPDEGRLAQEAPKDDPAILDAHYLIRRIDPIFHVVVDPKCQNRKRLTSMVFKASTGAGEGMSVDVQHLIEGADITPEAYVTSPKYQGSIRFTAGCVRSIGLVAGADPVEDNPYHGQVWASNGSAFTRAQERGIRACSVWFVQLPDVDIS